MYCLQLILASFLLLILEQAKIAENCKVYIFLHESKTGKGCIDWYDDTGNLHADLIWPHKKRYQ